MAQITVRRSPRRILLLDTLTPERRTTTHCRHARLLLIANFAVSIFTRPANSRRVWERLLTSILLLAGIAAGIAAGPLRAQQLPLATRPPAGPHRPAGVPANYVITPFGYFHPSCVLQLNKGEHMDNGGVLHHPDGSTAPVGPCQYPRYKPSGELVPASSQKNNSLTEQDQGTSTPPSITHSWIENSYATTSTAYGKEVSTWTVPPLPVIDDGQIISFFPGFENVNPQTILQPVLEFDPSYNGGAWIASSWNCCASGTAWESTPIFVNPGDTILGTTVMNCAAGTTNCSTWNVTTEDQTTNQSTELSNTPSEGQVFNWATGGALEVYYVNQCIDYPPNGSISFNTVLYDSNFNQIANPGWSNEFDLIFGTQPQCNYGVTTTATQTTLTYGTTGAAFSVGMTPSAGIAVNQGSSANGTLTIYDINGFNGLVQLSASNLPAGISAQISQGSSSNTYILTLTATSSALLTGENPLATLTLTATGSGVPTQTIPVNVIVNPPLTGGSGTVVDLGNYFNLYGFFDDQVYTIPTATSIDGAGDVYSANQLSPPGTSPMGLNVAGVQFEFGPPNALNAVNGTGSNPISLPSGTFTGLELLGASASISQGGTWPVAVTYTDGTTQTFTQSFDDWDSLNHGNCTSSCYGGESVADVTPYCDMDSIYPLCSRLFYLYRYYSPLDSSKTVESLTLPNARYIFVLAATLTTGALITPTVTVTPNATSITTDQPLAVTVTVSGGAGNPVPSGSIGLKAGSYWTSSESVLSGGNTTTIFNVPAGSLPPASFTFTATYLPDGYSSSTYSSSSGSSTPVAVHTPQTITFANPGTQTLGTPLTLSATASSGLAVTFTSATTSICTASNGTATFLASGTCIIDADQGGNVYFVAAPEVQQSFTVNGEAQTITFPTIPTQTVGTPLTLSATATSGLAVTFTPTTTSICTVSGGTATFLATGTCTIDANQSGNTTYAPAAMVPQSFTVNPAPTFVGSGGGGTISIVPGATTGNSVTISVTPANGFTGTVNLNCSISPTAASDPATCIFVPPSLTFTGATAQTSTLTIYTTAATSAANRMKHLFWPATGGTTLAVILLFGIPRKRHNWLVMLLLLVLFVSSGAMGCGGSSSSGGGGGGGGGNVGTTPGTYTATLTGTSGSLTVPLGTVTLVVQ
jgi:hypothetical protein